MSRRGGPFSRHRASSCDLVTVHKPSTPVPDSPECRDTVQVKERVMTQTMSTNGRMQRKSLNDQIDRLDGILDGLADALNESVAGAVRDVVGEVVRQAVEASIKQVLSNPDLLKAALAQHAPVA